MHEEFTHKTPVGRLLIIIFLIVFVGLISGLYFYNIGKDDSTKLNTLPTATSTITPDATATTTATATMDETLNWKTYTNLAYNFSFKYPTDITLLEGDTSSKTTDPTIQVVIEKIASIGDQPSGFDQTNTTIDKLAIAKNDPSIAMGWGLTSSYKILNITGFTAKEFTTLAALDICDIQLTETAIIYTTDSRIILRYKYNNIDKLETDNATYFTNDELRCGGMMWKNSASFYTSLIGGTTDTFTQTWYTNFTKIISTFKLNSQEVAIKYLNPKLSWVILILVTILAIASVGYAYYCFDREDKEALPNIIKTTTPTPLPTESIVSDAELSALTSDWQIYDAPEFSLKYPSSWNAVPTKLGSEVIYSEVRFRPFESEENIDWGLITYRANKTTIDRIISGYGTAFNDRKETRSIVKLGSIEVTKVVLTALSSHTYYQVLVLAENNTHIFLLISNTTKNFDFNKFYLTFRLK